MNLYISLFILFLLTITNCAKETKPVVLETLKNTNQIIIDEPTEPITASDTNKVLTAEEEAKIELAINFDGQWRKSKESKATIIINGHTGRVVANNGGEIEIEIRYLSRTRIKIIENKYNGKYLENWLPRDIAKQLELSTALRSYSILDIIDNDTLKGISFGWQVFHNPKYVEDIGSLVIPEQWKRIK